MQDAFVIWIALGAFWGFQHPAIASSGREWIPEMLAAVMLGMGLTLRPEDVKALRGASKPVLLGVGLQFLVMPLCAWLLAELAGLPRELAVGLILVGAAPGGTASNVVTWLARGDVALSIAMTTASTLLSPLVTPFWIWLLASAWLPVDPLPLFFSVVKIVLLPVFAGALVRSFWMPGRWILHGVLPLCSMLIIAWIVGVISGLNHDSLIGIGAGLTGCVLMLNLAGLLFGYLGARIFAQPEQRRRTVAIEVGMQNSGLAAALAVAHFSALAALPAAIFSIWHNVSGPMLAAIWRHRAGKEASGALPPA